MKPNPSPTFSPMRPEDVIAALRKLRPPASLSSIARDAGISQAALSNALRKPASLCERLIAETLNMPPHRIWPDRYDETGRRFIVTRQPSKKSTARTIAKSAA